MNDDILYQHVGLGRVRTLHHARVVQDATYFRPPTNVYETEDAVVVVVEVAGLEEGDYMVTLSDDDRTLTVSGRRHLPNAEARVVYHQLEIAQGRFITQAYLPWPLAGPEEATAIYEDGFLVINLPKAKPKHIRVRPIAGSDSR